MATDDVTFRPATRADVPAIVGLLADDERGREREAFADPLPDSYWRAYETLEGDPNNEMIVADLDGRVVGYLQLTYIAGLSRQGSTRAMIESVRVATALRGQGIGKRFFAWAIERARTRGCHLVQLTSDKRRTEAHRFYGDLGFVASHEGFKLQF